MAITIAPLTCFYLSILSVMLSVASHAAAMAAAVGPHHNEEEQPEEYQDTVALQEFGHLSLLSVPSTIISIAILNLSQD